MRLIQDPTPDSVHLRRCLLEVRGPGRKPGASSYTLTRLSLSLSLSLRYVPSALRWMEPYPLLSGRVDTLYLGLPGLTGARARAWCLLIHADGLTRVSLSLKIPRATPVFRALDTSAPLDRLRRALRIGIQPVHPGDQTHGWHPHARGPDSGGGRAPTAEITQNVL